MESAARWAAAAVLILLMGCGGSSSDPCKQIADDAVKTFNDIVVATGDVSLIGAMNEALESGATEGAFADLPGDLEERRDALIQRQGAAGCSAAEMGDLLRARASAIKGEGFLAQTYRNSFEDGVFPGQGAQRDPLGPVAP